MKCRPISVYKIHRRHFTIRQAPRETPSTDVVEQPSEEFLTGIGATELAVQIPSTRTNEHIELKTLGDPPSLIAITSPPSVAAYVRNKSLLLSQSGVDETKRRLKALDPFKSLLLGERIQMFQELIATEPKSYLVSSHSRNAISKWLRPTSSKTFATLHLDGAKDWAIIKSDALQIYGGPSLIVSMQKFPRLISRALARDLGLSKRVSTGLASLTRHGYAFIGGRGVAAVTGCGSIFAISIPKGESVVVDRRAVVSISVNGPNDLQNCVARTDASNAPAESSKPFLPVLKSYNSSGSIAKNILVQVMRSLTTILSAIYRLGRSLFLDQSRFIKIFGPRTILLQSDVSGPAMQLSDSLFLTKPEVFTRILNYKSSPDYLNIVTTHPDNKMSIRSTPDFTNSSQMSEGRQPK